jgi:hypothetical protein
MRLFSYVVKRDYGFAPNPYFGVCTLATCKPVIRRTAKIGDWIVGTGDAGQRSRWLVYAMKVSKTMSFNEYWDDPTLQRKKPNLYGSKKQAFGDNIYTRSTNGDWLQSDSHHTLYDGSPNKINIETDTTTNRILIADQFVYFGEKAPTIPEHIDICAKRSHRVNFSDQTITSFFHWLNSLNAVGVIGKPFHWRRSP